MPADGLAHRLARLCAALALAACLAGTTACRGADLDRPESLLASAGAAAAVSAAIVRSIDVSVRDDYVVRSLASGAPIGATEACIAEDNRLAQRPSPLADPPYGDGAIAQRDRAMRVLFADASLVAENVESAASDRSASVADLQRATFALDVAAKKHGAGDLFIEDRASELVSVARRVPTTANWAALREALVRIAPAMRQLSEILKADLNKHRIEAIAAANAALRDTIAYASTPGNVARTIAAPCRRPDNANRDAATVGGDVTTSDASMIPNGARERVTELQSRARALAQIDLDAVFEALDNAMRPIDASARGVRPDPQSVTKLLNAVRDARSAGAALVNL